MLQTDRMADLMAGQPDPVPLLVEIRFLGGLEHDVPVIAGQLQNVGVVEAAGVTVGIGTGWECAQTSTVVVWQHSRRVVMSVAS